VFKSTTSDAPRILFDKQIKTLQKEKAALAEDSREYDYLKTEIASRLYDRLLDILPRGYTNVLEYGCGLSLPLLAKHTSKFKIEKIVQMDSSQTILNRDYNLIKQNLDKNVQFEQVVETTDEKLPFPNHSFDLIISNLQLHWINNLQSIITQFKSILKPDGILLASLFGEDTLFELRNSFLIAEQEREGGIANHISPFATISDIGDVLTKARFALPTIDQEEVTFYYSDPYKLMLDLKGMGENNCLKSRRAYTPPETFLAMSAVYKSLYGKREEEVEEEVEKGSGGKIVSIQQRLKLYI